MPTSERRADFAPSWELSPLQKCGHLSDFVSGPLAVYYNTLVGAPRSSSLVTSKLARKRAESDSLPVSRILPLPARHRRLRGIGASRCLVLPEAVTVLASGSQCELSRHAGGRRLDVGAPTHQHTDFEPGKLCFLHCSQRCVKVPTSKEPPLHARTPQQVTSRIGREARSSFCTRGRRFYLLPPFPLINIPTLHAIV